jgi:hypothetical protein
MPPGNAAMKSFTTLQHSLSSGAKPVV